VLKGFRDFIMRGNVVDLAVGVVIGASFATLVDGFADSFITPLINMIGGRDIGGSISLPGGTPEAPNLITYGAFIGQLIGFAITAGVVYFLVVLPMNRLAEMRKKGEVAEPSAPAEDIRLLTEIRDALVTGKAAPHQRAETQPESTTR
jgi:large conductance mechanosensitive channel